MYDRYRQSHCMVESLHAFVPFTFEKQNYPLLSGEMSLVQFACYRGQQDVFVFGISPVAITVQRIKHSGNSAMSLLCWFVWHRMTTEMTFGREPTCHPLRVTSDVMNALTQVLVGCLLRFTRKEPSFNKCWVEV